MRLLSGSNVIARLLRLLVVASCVLPLAGVSTATASNPLLLPAPVFPANEEDETERQETSEEQVADPRLVRMPSQLPPSKSWLRATVPPKSISHSASRHGPTRVDPFRNGLGTPYRC